MGFFPANAFTPQTGAPGQTGQDPKALLLAAIIKASKAQANPATANAPGTAGPLPGMPAIKGTQVTPPTPSPAAAAPAPTPPVAAPQGQSGVGALQSALTGIDDRTKALDRDAADLSTQYQTAPTYTAPKRNDADPRARAIEGVLGALFKHTAGPLASGVRADEAGRDAKFKNATEAAKSEYDAANNTVTSKNAALDRRLAQNERERQALVADRVRAANDLAAAQDKQKQRDLQSHNLELGYKKLDEHRAEFAQTYSLKSKDTDAKIAHWNADLNERVRNDTMRNDTAYSLGTMRVQAAYAGMAIRQRIAAAHDLSTSARNEWTRTANEADRLNNQMASEVAKVQNNANLDPDAKKAATDAIVQRYTPLISNLKTSAAHAGVNLSALESSEGETLANTDVTATGAAGPGININLNGMGGGGQGPGPAPSAPAMAPYGPSGAPGGEPSDLYARYGLNRGGVNPNGGAQHPSGGGAQPPAKNAAPAPAHPWGSLDHNTREAAIKDANAALAGTGIYAKDGKPDPKSPADVARVFEQTYGMSLATAQAHAGQAPPAHQQAQQQQAPPAPPATRPATPADVDALKSKLAIAHAPPQVVAQEVAALQKKGVPVNNTSTMVGTQSQDTPIDSMVAVVKQKLAQLPAGMPDAVKRQMMVKFLTSTAGLDQRMALSTIAQAESSGGAGGSPPLANRR